MSATARRRTLLVSLVAICGLSACTTYRIGGYLWTFDAARPHCERVTWVQVTEDRIPWLCGDLQTGAAVAGTSCALGCVVISPYSEAEARERPIWGDTLYSHEERHVMKGMVHP